MHPKIDPLISQPQARQMFGGASDMTFHRWRKAEIIPAPVVINGRNFWPLSVLQALAATGTPGRRRVPTPPKRGAA